MPSTEDERQYRRTIGPSEALEMLKNVAPDNVGRMSANAYKAYHHQLARDMVSGRWDESSHEGICLGAGGCVIDGYNRLSAVVIAQRPVTFLVIEQPWRKLAREVVQNVGVPWKASFILGTSQVWLSAANLASTFLNGSTAKLTIKEQAEFSAIIHKHGEQLPSLIRKAKRVSSGPFVLASTMALASSRADAWWLEANLSCLANNDPKNLSPAVYSLWKQTSDTILAPTESTLRIWNAFDQDREERTRIQIKDILAQREGLKKVLRRQLPGLDRTAA